METTRKTCSTCRVPKPLDEFNRDAKRPDGRYGRCRECDRAASRAWYAANAVLKGLYENSVPLAVRTARNAARAAVKRGILVRKPCEVCGTGDHVEAHHDDYSKPLEVRWLCKVHHAEAHGRGLGSPRWSA